MATNWDNKKTESLLEAVLTLKDLDEAKMFFRDLLTPAELDEFGNRFMAAQMLEQKIPYTMIAKQTGLSSTTIARIAKWLKKGKGGYQLVIARATKHHHNSLLVEKGLS